MDTKAMMQETPEQVQWRNIRKVVKDLADFCFGSPDHPQYGTYHVALTTALTAKDGVKTKLDPLPAQSSVVPAPMIAPSGNLDKYPLPWRVEHAPKGYGRHSVIFAANNDCVMTTALPVSSAPLLAAIVERVNAAAELTVDHDPDQASLEFNQAIDFAIGLGIEAAPFLQAWREGDWESCAEYGFHRETGKTKPSL